MAYKFDECHYCLNRHDEDICDQCDCGELFEEDDELPDFDDDRLKKVA
jgi:hypothetical protein